MSIFDIAPSRATVEIGGKKLDVPGVNLADLVALLARFPALQAMLGGGAGGVSTPEQILTAVPAAAHAIMAAGLGHYGDEKAEAHLAKFAFGDQLKIFEAVVKASLPDGVDPTVARLNMVADIVSGNAAKSRAKK